MSSFANAINSPFAFNTVVRQSFTTAGTFTYTPTLGMQYCEVEIVGGGGGGGGTTSGVAGSSAAAGGAGGVYVRNIFSAATIGANQSVTVGQGGTGGAATGNTGISGTDTQFGVAPLMSATGGTGGSGAGFTSTTYHFTAGTMGGNTAIGDFIVAGGGGGYGIAFGTLGSSSTYESEGGLGGSSYFSPPTVPTDGGVTASNGLSPGGGGAGAASQTNTPLAGGNGANGAVYITEYVMA